MDVSRVNEKKITKGGQTFKLVLRKLTLIENNGFLKFEFSINNGIFNLKF